MEALRMGEGTFMNFASAYQFYFSNISNATFFVQIALYSFMVVVLDFQKITKKNFWIPLLKFVVVYAVYYFLGGVFFSLDMINNKTQGLLFSISYVFVPLLYVFILLKDDFVHKLLKFSFLASTILLTSELGKNLGLVVGILSHDNAFLVASLRALPSLACFGASFIMFKFNISHYQHLSGLQMTMFLILSYTSMVLVIFSNLLSSSRTVNFTAALYGIFIFCFFILLVENFLMYFYLYYSIMHRHQLMEKEMQVNLAELENEALKINKANLEELSKSKHDAKNQFAYLELLLEENKAEEAKAYLRQLAEAQGELLNSFQSQNQVINGIMNLELAKAKLRNVEIVSRVILPPILPFRDIDLVSLITNIMDNALENVSQKEKKPSIKITMLIHEDYFRIYCLNKVDGRNEDYSIAKKSRKGKQHGYGTKIIKEIAARYNGYASFVCDHGEFVCDCILSLNSKVGGTNQ